MSFFMENILTIVCFFPSPWSGAYCLVAKKKGTGGCGEVDCQYRGLHRFSHLFAAHHPV